MKVVWVVPRYGDDVVGGAESGVQMVAERMIRLLGWEMEVLTTCALEASTWANHYPEGSSELRGVRVQRFSCTGRDPTFDDFSRSVLADPAAASAEEQRRWFELQGPVAPDLLDAIAATDADVLVFKPYLYHPTVAGIDVASVPTALYGAVHDEPAIRLPVFRHVFASVGGLIARSPPRSAG